MVWAKLSRICYFFKKKNNYYFYNYYYNYYFLSRGHRLYFLLEISTENQLWFYWKSIGESGFFSSSWVRQVTVYIPKVALILNRLCIHPQGVAASLRYIGSVSGSTGNQRKIGSLGTYPECRKILHKSNPKIFKSPSFSRESTQPKPKKTTKCITNLRISLTKKKKKQRSVWWFGREW